MINFDYNFKPIKLTEIKGHPVYIVDDIYDNPQSIIDLIYKVPKNIHKKNEQPSYNMIHFKDERHCLYFEKLNNLIEEVSEFTNAKFKDFDTGCNFFTNCQMWYNNSFNNFNDNYWWPHIDYGITSLIYFNDDENSGTNIYEPSIDIDNQIKTNEHFEPWRPKINWNKIFTISSKFNRMIIFNGGKLHHGVDINNNTYDKNYRINQVMFFEE